MFEELKQEVYQANISLRDKGLVIQTWGNASGIDREKGIVVIKPSGVDYSVMKADDMVCVELDSGKIVDGKYKPSSDTPTHLMLYRASENIGGVVHTHSLYATAWAQACNEIPALGTTHADYFYGAIPCTRPLTDDEIQHDYELNTGKVILETFHDKDLMSIPAVLVAEHGPFTWGDSPLQAVFHADVLETLAKIAIETKKISGNLMPISQKLMDKHYLRKHGENAYYGQK